jgi:transcriptional regulator with XRE-family HTH domain
MSDKEMMRVKKSLGEILSALRREAGYTQPQVSELLAAEGVEIRTAGISKWEKGLTQPNAAQFLVLCKLYGVSDVMGVFTGSPGPTKGLNAEGRRLVADYIRVLLASGLYAAVPEEPGERLLPLYSLAASAGTGQFLDGEDFELVSVGRDVPAEADFGVRIAGDSMEPEIRDGQIVWVRRAETLAIGAIGIFSLNGQSFCKQLGRGKTGVALISLNSKYPPIELTPTSDLRVFGEAVM